MLRPGVPYMEEQMCTRACTAESSGPWELASGEWWLVVDLKQPGRGSTRPPRVASEACRVSAADAVKHGKPSRSSSPSCRVGCYGPCCGSRCGSRHSRDSHLSLPRRRSPASDTRRARAADRVSGRIERGTSESPRNPVRFTAPPVTGVLFVVAVTTPGWFRRVETVLGAVVWGAATVFVVSFLIWLPFSPYRWRVDAVPAILRVPMLAGLTVFGVGSLVGLVCEVPAAWRRGDRKRAVSYLLALGVIAWILVAVVARPQSSKSVPPMEASGALSQGAAMSLDPASLRPRARAHDTDGTPKSRSSISHA